MLDMPKGVCIAPTLPALEPLLLVRVARGSTVRRPSIADLRLALHHARQMSCRSRRTVAEATTVADPTSSGAVREARSKLSVQPKVVSEALCAIGVSAVRRDHHY
ncbi:hypothetical protein GCM10010486_20660 [Nonomuraea roseoviolacea subsp. carminata]